MTTYYIRIPDFTKFSDAELAKRLHEIADDLPNCDNHAEMVLNEALRRVREMEEKADGR